MGTPEVRSLVARPDCSGLANDSPSLGGSPTGLHSRVFFPSVVVVPEMEGETLIYRGIGLPGAVRC